MRRPKLHYIQEGDNIVKRPACNPSAYESYNWDLTYYWDRVTCKNCLRYRK